MAPGEIIHDSGTLGVHAKPGSMSGPLRRVRSRGALTGGQWAVGCVRLGASDWTNQRGECPEMGEEVFIFFTSFLSKSKLLMNSPRPYADVLTIQVGGVY